MDRAGLIEVIARELFDKSDGTWGGWDKAPEHRRAVHLTDAGFMVDGIKDFVGQYMRQWDDDACQVMADMWREEMSTPGAAIEGVSGDE